jgi:hypothetical protein
LEKMREKLEEKQEKLKQLEAHLIKLKKNKG